MEGLRERFMSRFLESARRRLDRAEEAHGAATSDALGLIATEMHGMAGEASLLELGAIGQTARACEEAARRGDRAGVDETLRALRAATAALENGSRHR